MYLILAVLAIALFADLRFPSSSEKPVVTNPISDVVDMQTDAEFTAEMNAWCVHYAPVN